MFPEDFKKNHFCAVGRYFSVTVYFKADLTKSD